MDSLFIDNVEILNRLRERCEKEGLGNFVDPRAPGQYYFKCLPGGLMTRVSCGTQLFNDERDKVCIKSLATQLFPLDD